MNLLILNGYAFDELSVYRGTYRNNPTYCDTLSAGHEINQLFMWFLEEGGESGVIHDLAKAQHYAKLCNIHFPDRQFEVVEVTKAKTPPESGGKFLGFDLSEGYNSLIGLGALVTNRARGRLSEQFHVLSELIARYFNAQLNSDGLFQEFEVASFCLQAINALQSFHPGLYEGDISDFEVVGVYLVRDVDNGNACR